MSQLRNSSQDQLLNLSARMMWVIIIACLSVCAFLLFYKIIEEPMHRWDESLFAKNAFHLAYEGNLPDYYYNMRGDGVNQAVTKPPFVFMIQATLMKRLGYTNNLAIRFHSITAAFILCCLLIRFSIKHLDTVFIGVFSALVLITNKGYMIYHGARGGDFDSLLVLFLSLASYFFYMSVNRNEYTISKKDLYLTALCLSMAVLTKSIAGLTFLPGFFLYALYRKKVKLILINPGFYIAIAILIIPIVSYYGLAELSSPGNFQNVLNHEVFGRYLETLHDNSQPFYYYILYLFANPKHTPWSIYLFINIYLIYQSNSKIFKQITTFSLFTAVSYIFVISLSQTKISWYIAPCYVFMAIINGIGLYIIFRSIVQQLSLIKRNNINKLFFIFLFTITFFAAPVKKTLSQILDYQTPQNNEGHHYNIYESGLNYSYNNKIIEPGDSLFILRDSSIAKWSPQLAFYEDVFEKAYNIQLIQTFDTNILVDGHIVLTSDLVINKYKLNYKLIKEFTETKLIESQQYSSKN